MPPARPFPLVGGEEDLDRGVGEHDGADVATLDDASTPLLGPFPLPGTQERAHGRMRRHFGHPRRHRRAADLGTDVAAVEPHCPGRIAELEDRLLGRACDRLAVAEVEAALDGEQRHGPVHRARVEHLEAEDRGDTARDGRLARTRGPVDGHDLDHDPFPPVNVPRSSAKRGYDTATECQPRTVDSPGIALAATAAASAIRWSPWLLNIAGRGLPPRIVSASCFVSTPTPICVNSCSIVLTRSLSFTRSPATPWISVTPSANAAATASTGISSIIPSSGRIVVATSGEDSTSKRPTGSPSRSPVGSASTLAPLARSAPTKPKTRGLRPTSSITIDEPGVMHAATANSAADDGSPGTSRSKGAGAPVSIRVVRSSTRATGARSASSMRSVWSRLGAGSSTSVTPSAW